MRKSGNVLQQPLVLLVGCAVIGMMPAVAGAQVASALLHEDDELLPGETISSIGNTAVNHVGGFACGLSTVGSGTTISRIWGNATGGPGMLMRSEGTFGFYEQTSFESFYGMSDTGQLAYSPMAINIITGETGLDGAWLDDLPVLVELDPVPSLPGMYSVFNSRPGVTGDGIIHWVGGFTDTQGGSTQNRAIFKGLGAIPLIKGGDVLPGIPEPVDLGGSIDFDWRVSRFGSYWIDQVLVDALSGLDGVMVINGAPVMAEGGILRENDPIPDAVGGLPGELWDNFDYMGIGEAGDYLITGDTNASSDFDEFILINGQIILREGDMIDLYGMPATLSGSIEGAYQNEDLDWAVIWDVDDAGGNNIEALILNGEILLVEGDLVDWNGDGVIDGDDNGGIVDNFTGMSALTIGPRIGGVVNVYFTADISFAGDELEGFFCLPVVVVPPITVAIDIKPGACPNPLNRGSNGVLPVAVAGTDEFDVMEIDLATVLLSRADGMGGVVAPNEGPPGPRSRYVDVTAPFIGEPCECEESDPDGFIDLSLKFRTSELVEALELDYLDQGELVELCVSGFMLDGTPFMGYDCIWLVPPGSPEGMIAVQSNLIDVWLDINPLDEIGDGGGLTPFNRFFTPGVAVTVNAPKTPELYPNWTLKGWWINGQYYSDLGTSVTVVVEGVSTTAVPQYVPRFQTNPYSLFKPNPISLNR